MKNAYIEFERLMDEEKVYMCETLSFEDICRMAGTEKDALESVLIEELGVGGEDLLATYRGFRAP